MGYVLPQLDDEEQNKQQGGAQQGATPTLGGSQTFGGGAGGGGGSATPAPQQTPTPQNVTQKGTGFTNLQNWLDAGKGRDQNITQTGGGLLGQERNTLTAAEKPVNDATYKANTVADVNAPGKGEDIFGENMWKAAGGDKDAKAGIQSMLNQSYTGARDVNYDPTQQKNLWDAGALSGADTAGQVLARPAIQAGTYNPGMQRLDSTLYWADSASRAAMAKQGANLQSFVGDVKSEKQKLAEKVAGFDKSAADANKGTADELQRQYGNLSNTLNTQVGAAQKADKDTEDAAAAGFVYNPATGRNDLNVGGENNALTKGASSGGGATRGNVMSDQQKSGFDLLNELIGTPGETKTGTHQDERYGSVANANYQATVPHSDYTQDDVRNAVNTLPPDQRYMWQTELMDQPGSQNWGAVQMQQFFNTFQREHPEVKFPDRASIGTSQRDARPRNAKEQADLDKITTEKMRNYGQKHMAAPSEGEASAVTAERARQANMTNEQKKREAEKARR